MNAFSPPSNIAQVTFLVEELSIEPRSITCVLSLVLFKGIINSASPKTAMFALCVTMITCLCSLYVEVCLI